LEEAPASGGLDFRYRVSGREREYRDLPVALLGRHQAANAAVALATLEELRRQGRHMPEEAVRAGLARASCPGRVEVVSRRPAIVLDVAHNTASVDALVEVLDGCFSARRRLLVFAATHEKDLRGMLDRLLGRFDEVLFTRYLNNPRAVPPEELAEMAARLGDCPARVCPDPAGAWNVVRQWAEPDDLVCVTGSFFLAGEIREQIRARPLTPGHPLAQTPT
jgi:dihydrofolate synthase/folylpolyglutamate synthase